MKPWNPYSIAMRRVRDRLAEGPATTAELVELTEMNSRDLGMYLNGAKLCGHIKPLKTEYLDRKAKGLGSGRWQMTTWGLA